MSEKMTLQIDSPEEMIGLGRRIGALLKGGEVLELVSDIGGGKTTLVRGIAEGAGSSDQVMSPTFTISRIYQSDDVEIRHFDFYRLDEPGIIAAELEESLATEGVVVVIEWSDIVKGVLPEERLRVDIKVAEEDTLRTVTFNPKGDRYQSLVKELA